MDNGNYQIPEARAMTREELKAFRASGFDPVFMDGNKRVNPVRLTAEMHDWILDNIYKGHDFSKVPCDALNDLCDLTFRKTYGIRLPGDIETKNS
ncbi:MAG: hypothetical protein N2491_01695 [Negativicutes bacterium]|nr:hypothetical protein [Negativicutes bacterium]